MKSLELFAGCGGLALGLEASGFEALALIEWDRHACSTLQQNAEAAAAWTVEQIHPCDARGFNYDEWLNKIDLIAAGVPCQPFSLAGRHRGDRDDRNMFPTLIDAVRRSAPRAVLVENVRGLARQTFRPYLEYILDQLRLPEVRQLETDTWRQHHARLRKELEAGVGGLEYEVDWRQLNAANFGVPQKRERVFIQAIRSDISSEVRWPVETHSATLLHESKHTGAYWVEHGIVSPRPTQAVDKARTVAFPATQRWRTVRDALVAIPPPVSTTSASDLPNHTRVDGARLYAGHTGSSLDEPAKTLKAGVHGVAGGEAILLLDDGSHRYLSVREAALLQTFPKDYFFSGSRTEAMRQIGNAVPVDLAAAVGTSIAESLNEAALGRSRGRDGSVEQVAIS